MSTSKPNKPSENQRQAPSVGMATYEGTRNESGEREGEGTMHFASGACYVGEWRANVREGTGTMSFAGGEVYEGEWINNKREGRGVHSYADGGHYSGEWRDGQRDGHGKYTFANGATYEGEYRAGKREGKGTFTYPNGVAQVARYEHGAPVREGVRWSIDHDGAPSTSEGRRVAWRLRDGRAVEGISLEQAAAIAERAGVAVPPVGAQGGGVPAAEDGDCVPPEAAERTETVDESLPLSAGPTMA